jgi:ribonuclease VapC
MVLDSSALVAIVLKEKGHELLAEKAQLANPVLIGAPTALESAVVLSRRLGYDARAIISTLLRRFDAEIVEFNQDHYEAALSAFLRFGKGRHPAALNFGDCMSYALAAVSGLPLLCTGDDFPRTDIQCA